MPEHPGGQKIILKYAGKDATKAFDPIHPPDIIQRLLPPEICKGEINTQELAQLPVEEDAEEKRVRLAREKLPRLDEMYNSFDFECKSYSVIAHFNHVFTYDIYIYIYSCCQICA